MARPKTFVFVAVLFLVYIVTFVSVLLYQFKGAGETPPLEVRVMPKAMQKAILHAAPTESLHVPVLIYHYIEIVKDTRDTTRLSLNIVPATFEAQIKTLVDDHFTFMTATQLADVLDGKKKLPPKPVLITIDDGHWDLATDIVPILKKYNVKATAYIVPGNIGGSDFLSKDQLKEVIHSNVVEIGAHTMHHVSLAHKIPSIVEHEVDQSKLVLEQEYHVPSPTFAYPGGSFDQHAIDVVKRAGFRLAFSTVSGTEQSQNNRFYLFRLHPGNRTGKVLVEYIQHATSLENGKK